LPFSVLKTHFRRRGVGRAFIYRHRPSHAEEFWRNRSTLPQQSANKTWRGTTQYIPLSNNKYSVSQHILILHI